MSPHPHGILQWPGPTPMPSKSYHGSNAARSPDPSPPPIPRLVKRQDNTILDSPEVAQAKRNCEFNANNDNVTCFPAAGDLVVQHDWVPVIWNSKRPQLDQFNVVDIFLFDADRLQPVLSVTNYPNPSGAAGQYNLPVNDSWWGDRGPTWRPGSGNFSYPFFFVITGNEGLNAAQTTNPTFTAVQTTYADSVASSLSVLSSLSAQSTATPKPSPSGSIQPSSSSSSFPHWAIAVIVVLGFLAIVAVGALVWLILRHLRQLQRFAQRGSMGSSSPIMANAQSSNSPRLPLLAGGVAGGGGRTSSGHHRPSSIVSPDGVSEISRTHSAGDQGPFSGADAAIMADAFRKALRKPEFVDQPVEESEERKEDTLINRELAEEGRDIRSVSSSRGVRVETLSDAGDTVQHH